MKLVITIAMVLGLGAPAYAGHLAGNPPGKAAATGVDRNADGRTNGKDYSPGQIAKETGAEPALDRNGDGTINGADYAPGQVKQLDN